MRRYDILPESRLTLITTLADTEQEVTSPPSLYGAQTKITRRPPHTPLPRTSPGAGAAAGGRPWGTQNRRF